MGKSSIPSSKQKNIINSSSDSKDDSISIEDMFEMSSTIIPITDNLVEGNNILKDEELHDRTFTVGNIFGLSSSFSSVEESLFEDQDIGNASLMSLEEEMPFLGALDTSGNSSVYSKEIKKEDIMRIESQKKNESKLIHRMKKKSPDFAGLLKKVFSPITKLVENSILEKNKISNSMPNSIVPENNKTTIYIIPTIKTMTSSYDIIDDSLSIEEIFGMSSTLSKANKNDTNLEEKSKSNDDKIIVKSQTYIEQALPLSNEETEENLEGEEIKNEEESPNKSITIGNLFGLTSGFSSANEAEEREKTKSTSLEDMYGMSSTFTQTDNTFMKDKSKNDKNHTKSQPYIEHTISIEDIIGLSSSFLPADNLHLPIKLETEDDRDKINHPSYFNEKKSEEEFPDRQITLGKLFGLSSSFSSEESVIEEGGNETPKSSIPSSKQKNIINSSSDSKDDSISIEDMFEMSSTIFPITDILVEGNNILKDEELHDRTFTVGNILGLSCSFSSVEESLIEDQDIGNASLMSSEEELPFLDALDTSGNSSVYSKEI